MAVAPNVAPWRSFAPILAVQFMGTLGFSIALPFLVFLVGDFGGAPWTYGLVGATYSACQLVGAPLLGRWSDRLGRRPILFVSEAGTLVGWLLFAFALLLPRAELTHVAGASLTWPLLVVFVARAVDGLTGGNVSVASAYVADLTVDDRKLRQRAFGWMGASGSFGFALGPALGAALSATRYGYLAPVLAAAFMSLVAGLLCLGLPKPQRRCAQAPPPERALTKLLGQQQRPCDRTLPAALERPPRSLAVRRLLLATFLLFLAFNLFYAVFPVRARSTLGWSAGTLGLFFTALSAAMMIAEGPVLSAATRRVAPRPLFAVGMAILAASFWLFATRNTAPAFIGALLFALGNGLSWPTFQARLSDAAPEGEQGAVQGAATSASSLASIAGLVLGGVFYAWLGRALFVIAAALFLALAFGSRWFWESPRAA